MTNSLSVSQESGAEYFLFSSRKKLRLAKLEKLNNEVIRINEQICNHKKDIKRFNAK